MERGAGDDPPLSPVSSTKPASSAVDNGGDIPADLTAEEYAELRPAIVTYHQYSVGPGQCTSILVQRVRAPAAAVWSFVRRFDRPQIYKHFIRSCAVVGDGEIRPGCLREVSVISGLPASTSTERLDVLDDGAMVAGFTIIGGEHRLRNYRSVTTVSEFGAVGGGVRAVVLESYVVDVPEGNTVDDTKLFAETFVRLNLQKLACVAEAKAAAEAAPPPPPLTEKSK